MHLTGLLLVKHRVSVCRLKVWDPFKRKHKCISGYGDLKFSVSSRLHMTEGGAKAFLLSGEKMGNERDG